MTRTTQNYWKPIEETSWHSTLTDFDGNRFRRRKCQANRGRKTRVKNAKNKLAMVKKGEGRPEENHDETMPNTFEFPLLNIGDSLDNVIVDTSALQKTIAKQTEHSFSAVFQDVVADEKGRPILVPIDGSEYHETRVDDLSPDTILSIRVFRFFDNFACGKDAWEEDLQNVNSGCLLWLPVHLKPGMHSLSGAKYGHCFTIHYLQVRAKHFNSAYFMANEGCSYPAKSFGATVPATTGTVNGKPLERGYFWFVSPASNGSTSEKKHFDTWGWKHVAREGPFDAKTFMKEWQNKGSPMAIRDLQMVLNKMRCSLSAETC